MVAEENKKFFHEKIREYFEDHRELQFDHAYSFLLSFGFKKQLQISDALLLFIEQLYEREQYSDVLGFSSFCFKKGDLKFKGDFYRYSFYSSKKLGEVFNTHLIFEDMVAYYISIRNVTPILSDVEEYSNTFPFEFPVLLRKLEAYLSLEQEKKVLESFNQIKKLINKNLNRLRGFTRDREKLYKKKLEVFFKYNSTSELINKLQLELTLAIVKEKIEKDGRVKNFEQVVSTLVEFIVLAKDSKDFALSILLLNLLAPKVDISEMIKLMKKCEDYDYLELLDSYSSLRDILAPRKSVLKEKKSKGKHQEAIHLESVRKQSKVGHVEISKEDILENKEVLKNDLIMENLIRKKNLYEITGLEKDLANTFKAMGLVRTERALESENDKD